MGELKVSGSFFVRLRASASCIFFCGGDNLLVI